MDNQTHNTIVSFIWGIADIYEVKQIKAEDKSI
jgi:hypothetical protein